MKEGQNPPPIAERRPSVRRRALLGGIIICDEGHQSFSCIIRDVTVGGARVTIPNRLIAGRVYLINIREECAYEANVVWARTTEAGLSFLNLIDLNKSEETNPPYVRRLWLARAKS